MDKKNWEIVSIINREFLSKVAYDGDNFEAICKGLRVPKWEIYQVKFNDKIYSLGDSDCFTHWGITTGFLILFDELYVTLEYDNQDTNNIHASYEISSIAIKKES